MPRSAPTQRAKPKNCQKGFSCKAACIAKNRQCLSPLQGQFRTYGEFLQNAVDTGVALSPFHQADVLSRQIAPAAPPSPPIPSAPEPRRLPADVTTWTTEGGSDFYLFKVGEREVEVAFSKVRTDERGEPIYGAEYLVDEGYEMALDLDEADRAKMTKTLASIFHYQVERIGTGTIEASAFGDDGQGDYRAYSQEVMGFSRPFKGFQGESQYAVVRNGKVDRAASRQKILEEERIGLVDSARADQEWAETKESLQQRRAEDREARRAALRSDSAPTPTPTPSPVLSPPPTPARAMPEPKSVPDGVDKDYDRFNKKTTYTFKVGNKAVEMYVSHFWDEEYIVGFKVGGSYNMHRNTLSDDDRAKVSHKLNSILMHHVSTMKSGMLSCDAWADGEEDYRAYAYTKTGFSRPRRGLTGGIQYAIVKDGKIDREASAAKVREDDDTTGTDPSQADKLWYGDPNGATEDDRLGAVGRLQRKRDQQRAARRAAAQAQRQAV